MDTKWKKFSRSLTVRIILNGLMIGCLLIEMMLCLKIYDTNKQFDNISNHGNISNLYGNTNLQEDFSDTLMTLMEYALVSSCQEHDSSKLKQLKTDLQKETTFQYQLKTKDTKGKEHTFSNCPDNTDTWDNFPIYSLYKGYLSQNTYSKDWENHYTDSYTNLYETEDRYDDTVYYEEDEYTDIDEDDSDYTEGLNFYWLQINDILRELCQGNMEYSQAVAQNMVENLDIYKSNVKDFLFYIYNNNSNTDYASISKTTLSKLYGTQNIEDAAKEAQIRQMIEKIADMYDLSEEDLTYDQETGLIYDDFNEEYYDPKTGEICNMSDSETYNLFVKNMKEEQKEDEQTAIEKPLTKEEKSVLLENITKVIFEGKTDRYQISIPVSAVLGTPKEYHIFVGVADYDSTQAVYMEQYTKNLKEANQLQNMMKYYVYAFIGVLFLLILVVLALFYVCGKKAGTEEIQYLAIDKWYTEIQLLIVVMFAVTGMMGVSLLSDNFSVPAMDALMVPMIIIALSGIFCIEFLCALVRKGKGGILLRQSAFGKLFDIGQEKLFYGKAEKRIMRLYIIISMVWLFLEFIGICVYHYDSEPWLMVVMQLVLVYLLTHAGIMLHRYLHRMEEIQEGVKRVKAGEITYQIPTNDSESSLNQFAKDINSLSEGLEHAVDEMVKSSRLKTELISNVSHDIKTPLTSIITYVDLMKKEDVQSEKLQEYIDVLDKKSQRLKTLTDDLFEAAKATSGAMAMDINRIDLGSLVNQAIGEFTEKLEKSDLEIRNNVPVDTCYIMADGRLTWRIMENLLGNVSKYALAGSRVYVDSKMTDSTITLTVKNISNTELNMSAEELMERFTRGDRSRNTEGSGLGLNIAQSLASLQHGTFHVEIDGDLFKAVLELPKAEKNSEDIGNKD